MPGPARCSELPTVVLPTGDMLYNMMASQLDFQVSMLADKYPDQFSFFVDNQLPARDMASEFDVNSLLVSTGSIIPTAVRTRFVKENILAIMSESGELLEWFPWKHWKSYDTDLLPHESVVEARYEIVDLLHFVFNLAFTLGMTPEMLYDGFMRKQAENRSRQQRGY